MPRNINITRFLMFIFGALCAIYVIVLLCAPSNNQPADGKPTSRSQQKQTESLPIVREYERHGGSQHWQEATTSKSGGIVMDDSFSNHTPLPEVEPSGTVKAMYAYLLSGSSPATSEERSNKNNVMGALTGMPNRPSGLVDVLVGIYQNMDQDVVVRDYAIQYLGALGPTVNSADKKLIYDTLNGALSETKSTIAGTALLAMYHWSRQASYIDKREIAVKASAIASDTRSGDTSKATALQVCAQLNDKDVASIAVQLATTHHSLFVRKSAAAVLRKYAAEDHEFALRWNVAGILENCHECF